MIKTERWDLKKYAEEIWSIMQNDGTVLSDDSIDGIQPTTPASKEYLGIFYDLLDGASKEEIKVKLQGGNYL